MRNRSVVSSGFVALVMLALAACSDSGKSGGGSLADLGIDDGASKGESTSALVSPEDGGLLKLSTGAQVKVPAGAVDKPLELGLKRPADPEALELIKTLPQERKVASAPYVVTPHGTGFKTSVEVTLPVAKERDQTKLKVVWLEDEEDTEWKLLGVPETEDDKAKIAIDHFSVLMLVESDEEVPANTVAVRVDVDPAAAALAGGLALEINGERWALEAERNERTVAKVSRGEYDVRLAASAEGYLCELEGGDGVRSERALQALQVLCELREYTVSGTLTGASASVLLLYSGGASGELSIAENGSFTLPVSVAHGTNLSLSVAPSSLADVCTVSPSQIDAVEGDVSIAISCSTPNQVVATVQDFITGEPIRGAVARVMLPTGAQESATSAADGSVRLEVPQEAGVVVRIEREGYAPQFVRIPDAAEERVSGTSWLLSPVGGQLLFEADQAVAAGVRDSVAEIALPAGSLVDAAGQAFAGQAQVLLTPIDPSPDLGIVPGGLTTVDAETGATLPLELFALLDLRFRSSAGAPLQLGPGATATLRIPVAARAAAYAPEVTPLYYYDETLGHWVAAGQATLAFSTSETAYYEVTVSRAGAFSAARPLDTVTYSSCLSGLDGNPVRNALIQAVGVSYLSITTARTAADGTFSIPVGASGSLTLSSVLPLRSRVREVSTDGVSVDEPVCLEAADADVRLTLTWGAEPSDLDLHLIGEGFHVYHSVRSAVVGNTEVRLDTDQTDGNGPEVISAGRLPLGRYRVVVHHYGGESSITSSPARLRVQAPGIDSVILPSTNVPISTGLNAWVALDLLVSNAGAVSVAPVDLFADVEYADLNCPDASAPEPLACTARLCADGQQAISLNAFCDGAASCTDRSDENNAECPDSMFACSNGGLIPHSQYCDGYWDCVNGSDEGTNDCPSSSFTCGDGGHIPSYFYCDGSENCEDGSDEIECPAPDVFECGDGQQIDFNLVCDGVPNCEDGSDEFSCF